MRLTLEALEDADEVLLVASATQLDEDLDLLLPLVLGRRASIAVTRWDLVADHAAAREAIGRMALATGLPFVVLDARRPGATALEELQAAVTAPGTVRHKRTPVRAGWRIEPQRGLLDHKVAGPATAVVLLVVPAVLAVLVANQIAAWLEPLAETGTIPLAEQIVGWPGPLGAVLAGDYGLLTMGPLLFVWAVPTVLVYCGGDRRLQGERPRRPHRDDAPPPVAAGWPARARRDADTDGLRLQRPGDRLDMLLLGLHPAYNRRRDRLRVRLFVPTRRDPRGLCRRGQKQSRCAVPGAANRGDAHLHAPHQ